MERQFRFNWSAIVEEAKQRRKKNRLTQQRLALLAGVSTPTISRFEQGDQDIQLSSVLPILHILGMVDKRQLNFVEPNVKYNPNRDTVIFWGQDGDKKIRCEMTSEAFEDHYPSSKKSLVLIFSQHHLAIEQVARRKYLSERIEPDGSVLIKSEDL